MTERGRLKNGKQGGDESSSLTKKDNRGPLLKPELEQDKISVFTHAEISNIFPVSFSPTASLFSLISRPQAADAVAGKNGD